MAYGIESEKSENRGGGFNWGGVAGAALGMIGSRIFAGADDRRQLRQQEALNKQAVASQKEMSDYNYNQSLRMWEATGYGAQKEQMEKAGLNPALMYGGAGSGGSTGISSGTGASGGQAANAAATQGAATAQGMGIAQTAMMTAQMENIKANTKKTEAEATQIGGAGTANIEANTELTKARTKLEQIAGTVQGATVKDAIQNIVWGAKRMEYEAGIAGNEQSVGDGTIIEKQNIIKQAAIGAMLENQAKKTGMALDRAKIDEISNSIRQKWETVAQGWSGLDQNQQRVEIEKFGKEMQANYPGVWNVAGKYVNDFVDGLNHLLGQKDYKKHKVE